MPLSLARGACEGPRTEGGAWVGGFGGGAYEGFSTNAAFKTDFDNCLRERGHQVIQ